MGKAKSKELNKYFLKLSNKLSEINQFETFPNPCVGAVLVYKTIYRLLTQEKMVHLMLSTSCSKIVKIYIIAIYTLL